MDQTTSSPTVSFTVFEQFLRYAVVGVMNTAINLIILNVLSHVFHITKGEKVIWISVVAFIITMLNSYFMNKHWAFRDTGHSENGLKPTKFLLVSLVGLAINSTVVYLVTTYIPPVLGVSETVWLNVAAVIATGVSLIWNFTGYKLFVFKK